MTQEAIVVKTYDNGQADVVVNRGTACGSNCGSCETCIYAAEMHAQAFNEAGAHAGQKVIIESSSAGILKAELLLFIFPLAALILGYAAASMLSASEGGCILTSIVAFAVSVAVIVLIQRGKDPATHRIIKIIG